jgi:uncharacterized protein
VGDSSFHVVSGCGPYYLARDSRMRALLIGGPPSVSGASCGPASSGRKIKIPMKSHIGQKYYLYAQILFDTSIYRAYNNYMDITFDPNKNERNIAERDLSFERAADFDFDTAVYLEDDRNEYGETRFIAVGYLYKRLHVLCFVATDTGIRVISFRKANDREVIKYDKPKIID